jgi:hypothetical protein
LYQKADVGMKIEEIIRTTTILNNSKRIILNIVCSQNIINEKFNEVLRPYDLSGEQFNVLRILRGQVSFRANDINESNTTTRLVDKHY